MDTLYRRALVFPSLNGDGPDMESLADHPIEQCAENIALPYVIKAAKEFLGDGTGGKVITIYSLSMAFNKQTIPFCGNCNRHAKNLVAQLLGLRIVDRHKAGLTGVETVYQSDATVGFCTSFMNVVP